MRLKEITVKIDGKKKNLPVHFGFNTQADFCDELEIGIEDFDSRVGGSKMRLGDIRALAFYAFRNGHNYSVYKDTTFDLTHEKIGMMFDENPGLITELFKLLVDAQPKTESTTEDGGNVTS
jgi:hypothetical protein